MRGIIRSSGRNLSFLRPWLSSLLVLAIWQIMSAGGALDPRILPSPMTLAGTAGGLVIDGSLGDALLVSTTRVLVGSMIGGAVGLAAGLAAGLWRVADDLVDRPFQMLRTIPFTAVTPLLILWLGFGETPKIALVALAVAVPLYLNTVNGVRGVDRTILELAAAYRLPRGTIVRDILLPGALPSILVGLRHALGVAWIAVIVAETVNASAGVGWLLGTARLNARTDIVIVCVLLYALLGLVTDALVRLVERRALRWRGADSSRSTSLPRERETS